jgi:DNA-binding PadR family transcriptional regulator
MSRKTFERDPAELLPLKPLELLILAMLANGERHGYGLHQDIVAHTKGRIAPEAGNMYRHIRRLQAEGVIDETEPRRVEGSDDRRIYYRLCPFGRRVLNAEMRRLRELFAVAEDGVAPIRS